MASSAVKKVPLRKCVGCGESKPKKELIRVVREPDGNVCLDFIGKKSGRGAYVCRSSACLKKAVKSKRLEKNLDTSVPPEIYAKLEAELKAEDVNNDGK